MVTIFHNGECSKSKGALEILQEHNIPHEIRYYLIEPLGTGELKSLLQKLGLKAEDIVRKREILYLEQFEGKKLTEEQWLLILAANPILMERPIVVSENKAFIARPPERVLEIL